MGCILAGADGPYIAVIFAVTAGVALIAIALILIYSTTERKNEKWIIK